MAGVTLSGISKTFQDTVTALNPSDLDISDGEFMVLVGPSGCGKSTTLRIIAGLEEPDSGTITIGGRKVNSIEPKDRDIAMVFQNYALYPHMTVRDNLSFGLRMRKISRQDIDKTVADTASILGITELLERKPAALSGGQQQRVALGRAMVREPVVFLLDEPLSNLDAKLRTEMRRELKLLHQRLKTTMIYVTHDQVEAMTLGDRICVMNEGRILQVGHPLDVYNRPADRFTAGFLGTPPINFFEGELLAQLTDNPEVHTAGIRPEDIEITDTGKTPVIRAVVEVTEQLGNEQIVYLRSGSLSLTVKSPSTLELAAGETVECLPDMKKAHLFDKEGKNISVPD